MSKYKNSNSLQTTALQCERGGRVLFDNLAFELHAGEALLVQGANGSGKTSLLRIITGLTTAIEGDVLWNGARLRMMSRPIRENCYLSGIRQRLNKS